MHAMPPARLFQPLLGLPLICVVFPQVIVGGVGVSVGTAGALGVCVGVVVGSRVDAAVALSVGVCVALGVSVGVGLAP